MSKFERQLQRRTRLRRVVLKRPADIDRFGTRSRFPTTGEGSQAELVLWCRAREQAARSPFKTHPVVRLTPDGIDWGAAPRAGDEIGYGMDPYDTDDCLRAAIATATQVPIEEVPALTLDQRLDRGEGPDEISRTTWQTIDRWADDRGLEGWFHEDVPVSRRRWIGVIATDHQVSVFIDAAGQVVPDEESATFNDHCLVMSHEDLVFDPSCSVKLPPGMRMMAYDPSEITYGISFDRKE